MDVDLLRPGTVPISPDTVLWFEFLLNPKLLKEHLSKASPGECSIHQNTTIRGLSYMYNILDPSATDLITKFSSVMPPLQETNKILNEAKPVDPENPSSPTLCIIEAEKYSKKHLALKVLCLKVAAALQWNLCQYNFFTLTIFIFIFT